MARFEDLLEAGLGRRMTDICKALGVSERLLRECCNAHLRLSPSAYRRRRAMQRVHRALRSGDPETTSVSEIAGLHGFRDPNHFAAHYRAIYGELPSATLRRDSDQGVTELRLGRRRVKLR